ncbi:uncharacterized protein LOC124910135 [Impatiens glandulifera]|uniref:uncharacterized protein LOC124910135 n=1 Tax=Impatiens glandulifera TaxID=253017 RepID=UPI001FB077E6|nr:uncharacterized protein LOC124910135 [Impatiens glandulifera]
MESKPTFFFFFSILHILSLAVASDHNSTTQLLDVLLQDRAFRAAQHRPMTGELFNISLPSILAGVRVSVVRLRSNTLWREGANFCDFVIPRRTLPFPYVRRILISFQDFGNRSSEFFKLNLTDFMLVSSVVSLRTYDATNFSNGPTKVGLDTMTQKIMVRLSGFKVSEDNNKKIKCAKFGSKGNIDLSDVGSGRECYGDGKDGYFCLVVPSKGTVDSGLWVVVGLVIGFAGLLLFGFCGLMVVWIVKVKKIHEMEKEADDGLVLRTVWIGGSKMPSAVNIRTHPILENAP